MKVVVTVEASFVVEVDTLDPALARRAVEANWESIYKFEARWLNGTAPQYQGGRIVSIEEHDVPPGFK